MEPELFLFFFLFSPPLPFFISFLFPLKARLWSVSDGSMDPPRTPSTNQTHSVAWLGSAVVERKEKTTNKTTKTDGKGFMHLWAGDGEKLSSSTRAGWLGFACSGVLRNKMRRVDRILGMGVFGASDHMAERNESLTTQNHDKTGGLFVFFFFFFRDREGSLERHGGGGWV